MAPPKKSKKNNGDTDGQGRLAGMDVRQSQVTAVRRNKFAHGRWMTQGDVLGSGFRVAIFTDCPGLCLRCRHVGRDCPLGMVRGVGSHWSGAMDCSAYQSAKPVTAVKNKP